MPSLTVENYLKAALLIAQREGSEWVATGQLAEALNVSPGTVTSMLKTLAESKLAEYRPYEGVRLTDAGRTLALRVLRRHRLIELFLVQTLDLTWDQVHEEAEHMEHAVSDFLIDRIDEHLGRPEHDPHGDPIPSADGSMRADHGEAAPLSLCAGGTRVTIVRVTNQDPGFLRFLSERKVQIGDTGTVTDNEPESGAITVELANGSKLSLGRAAAEQLLVQTET